MVRAAYPPLSCCGPGLASASASARELRCAEPVIDLRLFRHTAFSIANMAHVLANIASFTVLLLVPYYLLNSYQASAFVGGVFLATAPLGTMLARAWVAGCCRVMPHST